MSTIQPVGADLQSLQADPIMFPLSASVGSATGIAAPPAVPESPIASVLTQVDNLLGQLGLDSGENELLRMMIALLILQALLSDQSSAAGPGAGGGDSLMLAAASQSLFVASSFHNGAASQTVNITQESTLIVAGLNSWNALTPPGALPPDCPQLDLSA